MGYYRRDGESIIDYAKRLLEGVESKEYDLDKIEIYNLLFDKELSSPEARKRLYGLKDLLAHIDFEKIVENEQVDNISQRYKTNIEIKGNGQQSSETVIKATEEDMKDVDFILQKHGYKVGEWELVNAKSSIWNTQRKGGEIADLYSSKITVKPVNGICMDKLQKHFKNFKPKGYKPVIASPSGNKMLEVPIVDLHLGKLGSANETGEDYNHDIASELFLKIIYDIKDRVKDLDIEKVIFPIGSDFFNFDTMSGTTQKGTPQSNSLSWNDMFLLGTELLVEGIEILRTIAPVECFYIPGNHDYSTSFYLTNYLYAWYRDAYDVTVDRKSSSRKYIKYGNSLIGFAHGDKERKRITNIMQVEAKEQWSATKFHEWHLAHLHSEQVAEDGGIITRNLSSVTSSDSWHYQSGYIGAIKKCQCFVWDKTNGLESIENIVFS